MTSDTNIDPLLDVVEECAFEFRTYGTPVSSALETIRNLWRAGISPTEVAPLPLEEFRSLVQEHQAREPREEVPPFLDLEFCHSLENALGRQMAVHPDALPSPEALDEVISRYRRVIHPKAFSLLEALARQSDLPTSKRDKEALLQKVADLAVKAKAQGVPLPPELEDIVDFSAPRYKSLSADIPHGQSINDFYVMNQVRYKLARTAPSINKSLRETGVPRNIFWGSLELSTPGAEIRKVDGADEFLVVLSRALWTATSLATIIVTRCVKLDLLNSPVDFDKSVAKELVPALEMLDRTLRCEVLEYEYPAVTDEQHKLFAETLDSATKTFIMGHEYAHFLAGHVDPSSTTPPDTAHSWNQELYADLLAVQLASLETEREVMEQMAATPPPPDVDDEAVQHARQEFTNVAHFYMASGAALVLYLFWRMDALHDRSVSVTDSHPPVAIRLANLWTFFRMTLPGFHWIYQITNLMLRDFISLLPAVEGSWRDRFAETALRPLVFHSYDAVIDMIDKVNTGEPLEDPALEPVRVRLEELFRDPAAPYEEKYSFLEECVQMVRTSRQADPLWETKDALRRRGVMI